MKQATEKNMRILAFAAVGGSVLNGVLMSQGIETMPGMWVPEVYEKSMLGLSLGSVTGISLGGVAGASLILAKEAVAGSIELIRNRFCEPQENNTNKLKM